MSIKDKITSAINKAKETTQKLTEKKMLKIKDIVLIPEFQKLLAMEESVLEKMKEYFDKGIEVSKDAITKASGAVQDFGDKSVVKICHYYK